MGRERALAQVDEVEKMLERFEKNGGRHFGLYALRADVYALRGDKDRAAAELKNAWEHGWRASWRTRYDPFLVGVEIPKNATP